MTDKLRVHAVEEARRIIRSGEDESSVTERRISIFDSQNKMVTADWLEWIPLVIAILEILSEWLDSTRPGMEKRILAQAARSLPDELEVRDLIEKLRGRGE